MTDFKNGVELVLLCGTYGYPVSEVIKRRERNQTDTIYEALDEGMEQVLAIMKNAASEPTQRSHPSMGGLIGGGAGLVKRHLWEGKSICGGFLSRAIFCAMAMLEINSSMGLIVAAPTAGSSGVVPGVLLALSEEHDLPDSTILPTLYNASAIGYLAMWNATASGAVGDYQTEVGAASVMTASAAVESVSDVPAQCLEGVSIALANLLGLVCDPVGGLAEYPYQNRNAIDVANASISAELALNGVRQLIPFDEMLAATHNAGRRLFLNFRETAMGGYAVTPPGCAACRGRRG